jgi:hypothetical protein
MLNPTSLACRSLVDNECIDSSNNNCLDISTNQDNCSDLSN